LGWQSWWEWYIVSASVERVKKARDPVDLRGVVAAVGDVCGLAEVQSRALYPNIILVSRPRKSGLGTAITDVFRFILSLPDPPNYIIAMDAATRITQRTYRNRYVRLRRATTS
jgi:hypothetical protein